MFNTPAKYYNIDLTVDDLSARDCRGYFLAHHVSYARGYVCWPTDQLTNQPLQGIWITNEYTKNTAILIITVMTSGIWAVRNILTGYAQLLFFVEDCKLW